MLGTGGGVWGREPAYDGTGDTEGGGVRCVASDGSQCWCSFARVTLAKGVGTEHGDGGDGGDDGVVLVPHGLGVEP